MELFLKQNYSNVGQIIFVSLLLSLSFPRHLVANEVYGTIKILKGDVKIVTATKGAKAVPAKLGQKIKVGEKLTTGKDSRAKIIMMDSNEISLSPMTNVQFKKYVNDPELEEKNVLLYLIHGKLRNKVKVTYLGEGESFRVRTDTGIVGVKGTDFLTSFDSNTEKTQVIAFSGKVEFGKGINAGGIIKPVLLKSGQTSSCSSNQKPSRPKVLSAQSLARNNRDSQVKVEKKRSPKARTPAAQTKTEAKSSPVFDSSDLPSECLNCVAPVVPDLKLPPPRAPTKEAGTCPTCALIEDGNTKVNIRLTPAK